MKNIIISFIFASLVFGVDLEPTKPRIAQIVYDDLKSDLKTVEVGSDDYKFLLGALCSIESDIIGSDMNKECDKNIFQCELNEGRLIGCFYPHFGEKTEEYMPEYVINFNSMANGDILINFGQTTDYSHGILMSYSEEIQKKIAENSLYLSEKFIEKYSMQINDKYVGEKISTKRAFEILKSFNNPYEFIGFAPIDNFIAQNIYNDTFYILDKACLTLRYEIIDEGSAGIFGVTRFDNGKDFDSNECQEVFETSEVKKLLLDINEKTNRFILRENVIEVINGGMIDLRLADYLNNIDCFFSHYDNGEFKDYDVIQESYIDREYNNEALMKIFNNEDKENTFIQNYETAIFEKLDEESMYGGLKIRKGKYNTGIMFGKEELIVSITEKGVEKLFEKPNEKEKYSKMRCNYIGH